MSDNSNIHLEVLQDLIEAMRKREGERLMPPPPEHAPEAHAEHEPPAPGLESSSEEKPEDGDDMSSEDAEIISQLFGDEDEDKKPE